MSKKLKIPAHYCQHWKDGTPTGIWWLESGNDSGRPELDKIGEGFFVTYHPEQELESETVLFTCDRIKGLAMRIKQYKPPPIEEQAGVEVLQAPERPSGSNPPE